MRCRLWPGPRAAHRRDIARDLARRGHVCFIAFRDGRAAGFAEAAIRPYANGCDDAPVPFIEGLWVESAARRDGVGRALVAAVERWAKKLGFRELGSDALIDNRVSHKAHRAYGFREKERVVYFNKKL